MTQQDRARAEEFAASLKFSNLVLALVSKYGAEVSCACMPAPVSGGVRAVLGVGVDADLLA